MSTDSMIDGPLFDGPLFDGPLVDGTVEVAGLDDFRGLSGFGRDRAYMAVECEVRRLQALQAAMLFEVHRSSSFLDDFHHSTTAWLQAVTNSSRATAARTIRTAKMLSDLTVVTDAVAAGEVGGDQYRDHEASRANRSVRSSQSGAGHLLHAQGDAFTGEIITDILHAHTQAEFETDLTERAARYGDDANLHPLARTARQRRYDALLAIFLKAAATTGTTSRVPLINILCTQTTLSDAIRDYFQTNQTNQTNQTDPTDPTDQADQANQANRTDPVVSQRLRWCETTSGAPVDPHDLVTAALIGQVRRVVVDSAGRVIDLGRRRRLFTGAAREAVLLSGDRCCWPGCNQRSANIQIDHLDPWAAAGGATNPFNGGPQCPTHNRDKHHGRITVKRDHTGWHHHRPNGTEIAPRTRIDQPTS